MGQSITSNLFRTGELRKWDFLFVKKNFRNQFYYDWFGKCVFLYVEGFFRNFYWNGRMSFYSEFLFSHIEMNYNLKNLSIFIFLYNTRMEQKYFNFLLICRREWKKIKIDKLEEQDMSDFEKLVKSDLFLTVADEYSDSISFLLNGYKHSKKYLRKTLKSCMSKKWTKNLFKSLRWFLKYIIGVLKMKKLIQDLKYFMRKAYLMYKKGSLALRLERKRLKFFSYIKFFVIFRVLWDFRYYKSFFFFSYYIFLIKPVELCLQRMLFKDFFSFKFTKSVEKFSVQFKRISRFNITADLLGRSIWLKLYKKYTFGSILYRLLFKLKRLNYMGVAFLVRGRFTRKQRAWSKDLIKGVVRYGSKHEMVDEFYISVSLRYGRSSVRVYLDYAVKKNLNEDEENEIKSEEKIIENIN